MLVLTQVRLSDGQLASVSDTSRDTSQLHY